MTVKELIKVLSKFNENDIAIVNGGEGCHGNWGYLMICENEEDAIWQNGEIVLEMEGE